MNIGEDARAYLLTVPSVTTLITARIYPQFLPANGLALPALTYLVVSSVPQHDLAGYAGWTETRIQIDSWATHALGRDALAQAVWNALEGYSGTMGNSTVTACLCKGSRDLFEPPLDNSDTGLFRNTSDFWLRHLMAQPTLT